MGREKKIERIVDDGMQCRTEESSCAASFLCVSKYRYPVCKIMYIASVILCLEDIFLTGVQVEMLIRELKKKHISAFGKYKIEY